MAPPAAAAAPAVHPRRVGPGRGPLTVPGRPRRVSGPARRPARARPSEDHQTGRRSGDEAGLALGVIEVLGRLRQPRLLDRLIQGRISIALVAFALIGIVTMQLGLLKLNAGIGRALEREALLQRENAALSIENSEMAAGDRVELRAARLGMELVSPGALHFLSVRSPSLEASRGAAALSTPVSALPGSVPASGSTIGEGSASSAARTGEASPASGATPGEASSATPASSAAPSVATTSEAAGTTPAAGTGAAASGEVAGTARATGVAPTSSSSGQPGGSGEGAAGAPASTGGGATAPSG
jgi:hypothetical protein